jgi:hypothetical protein
MFYNKSKYKRAELKFDVMLQTRIGGRAYFEEYHFSIKELKDEIDNYPRKDGWVGEKVHIDKKSNWVEITYRDRGSVTSYYTDFYICKPSSIDWKTFLTILEQAKVILKKGSHRTAELKFKLEHNNTFFYRIIGSQNLQWMSSERDFHLLPLKELIHKVSKYNKKMKLSYNTFHSSQCKYQILFWENRESQTPHQHEIIIYQPKDMDSNVFKTLVADKLDRILK